MIRSDIDSGSHERARREEIWREAQREAAARVRSRLRQVSECLQLAPPLETAFIAAVSELARQHAAALSYAHYEFKEGHPWPDELRSAEERRWNDDWEAALEQLRSRCHGG